jgi:hypothetical protein
MKLEFQKNTIREGDQDPEALPELLRAMVSPIILANQDTTPKYSINALGFNCSFVISLEDSGLDGTTFCRNEFLVHKAGLELRLGNGRLIANQAKLVYEWDGLKINLEIAPHFGSGGRHLFISINVHQDFSELYLPTTGLEQFDRVKHYVQTFPNTFLND